MATNIPFTALDFEQAKANIKQYLRNQDKFKDYDFEGSNMAVLIDILAYNLFQTSVYNNMAFSEMFLDSVQLRDNAMSHAKELGYTPSSRVSALSRLNLNMTGFDTNNPPSSITVARGTRFRAVCGNQTFTFITDKSYTALRSNGLYSLQNVYVYEGTTTNEFYTVDSSIQQFFVINNENVDINSVRVYVRDSTDPNSTKREYTRETSIFGVGPTDLSFYVEPHFDNLYKVTFGRDRFGRQPINGNVIEIEYRTTKGEIANGATNFSALDSASGGTVISVTSSVPAINGGERESIEDIKYFAPKSLQVQERAVTARDYEVLLKTNFPNIQAISVFGGEELDPPRYGRVVISVDVLGSVGVSDSEIREYTNFLRTKTPITIEPIFTPAKFVYSAMDLTVYYDPRRTSKSQAQIRQEVIDAIVNYSETNLNDFNQRLRQSQLSTFIDNVDESIVSNDLVIDPIIEISPDLNTTSNPSFTFNTALRSGYPLNESRIVGYSPSLITSNFYIGSTLVFLMDNGLGSLVAITSSAAGARVFQRNVGTVDYDTGEVKLSNLTVSQYSGTGIKFRGITSKNDVDGIIDRVLSLREDDINITIVPVR